MACSEPRCKPLFPLLTTLMWNTSLPFIYKVLGISNFDMGLDMSSLNDLKTMFNMDGMGLDNIGGMRGPGNFMRSTMNRMGVDPAVSGSGGGQGGNPLSGAGCICSSPDGSLKIVCCQSGGSCTFDCGALSNPTGTMVLGVCGGQPPYTWQTTKGTIAGSGSNQATLTKPANTGSGVDGQAYRQLICALQSCGGGFTRCNQKTNNNGCNDQLLSATDCCTGACDLTGQCPSSDPASGCQFPTLCSGDQPPGGFTSCNQVHDTRSAPMIAAGCNPCKVALSGAVVTVTDAVGATAAKTITT